MNKFFKTLTATNSEIKETRGKNIASQAEIAQSNLVNELRNRVLQLENKIENHLDLGPTSSFSLKVGESIGDTTKWVKELHEAKVSLAEAQVELDIAEETQKEWFTTEVKDEKGAE